LPSEVLDHLLVIEQTVERSFNSEVEHDAILPMTS